MLIRAMYTSWGAHSDNEGVCQYFQQTKIPKGGKISSTCMIQAGRCWLIKMTANQSHQIETKLQNSGLGEDIHMKII